MALDGESAIAVYVGGLDPTMARSVQAFLEARHAAHFRITERTEASVLLVDLDLPSWRVELATVAAGQVVLGIGFAESVDEDQCRHYVQKPLRGAGLIEGLSEVVTTLGGSPSPAPSFADRPSHARDIFTKGREWSPRSPTEPAPTPAWRSAAVPDAPVRGPGSQGTATLARPALATVRDREARIVDLVDDHGTSGGAAEVLGRRIDVEHVDARSEGSLADPHVLASFRYDPAHHLDGLVRATAAAHPREPWVLEGPAVTLVGDPRDDSVLVCGPLSRLRPACAQPPSGWSSQRRRPLPGPEQVVRLPAEVLMWNLSVWCADGRLASPVDPFGLWIARRWPDVPRVALVPGLLPTIALATSGPIRPAEIAEQLGLPRSHVFTVLSGLHGSGLLEPYDTAGPRHGAPVVEGTEGAQRGVLRRLIGRLRDR